MNSKDLGVNQSVVSIVQKLTRFFRNDKVSYDEYASNLIMHLVGSSPATIQASLSDLSTVEKQEFSTFARSYFDQNDFMPHPTVFMTDTRDRLNVEKKRKEMRPKYERLMAELEELAVS